MKNQEDFVEVFWKAFKSLDKKSKELLAARILSDEEFSEDWIDHILIQRSRAEKGQDVSLQDYLEQRKNPVLK